MHNKTHLTTGLTAAAFLLIGTLAVAQTAPQSRNVRPREASSGQASGALQRKDGAIHSADYIQAKVKSHSNSTNNRDAGNSGAVNGGANATAHPNSSNNATTGSNPLYQGNGTSGTNPMYEGQGKANQPGASTQRKHLAGVKYEDRTASGNNDSAGQPAGMAVNEQGSSTAPIRKKSK